MIHLKDGLYRVEHGTITAAFVVRGGVITVCAPILRKNIEFFARKAKLVPTDVELPPPVLAEA
jgi:hypothetical protein